MALLCYALNLLLELSLITSRRRQTHRLVPNYIMYLSQMVMFHPDASQRKELLGSASISCGVARRMAFWSCGDGKLMGIWWENVGYSHESMGLLVHESSWWKFIPGYLYSSIYILVINLFKLIYMKLSFIKKKMDQIDGIFINCSSIHHIQLWEDHFNHITNHWGDGWNIPNDWHSIFFPKCMDICLI